MHRNFSLSLITILQFSLVLGRTLKVNFIESHQVLIKRLLKVDAMRRKGDIIKVKVKAICPSVSMSIMEQQQFQDYATRE